jgi:hypothetical protein
MFNPLLHSLLILISLLAVTCSDDSDSDENRTTCDKVSTQLWDRYHKFVDTKDMHSCKTDSDCNWSRVPYKEDIFLGFCSAALNKKAHEQTEKYINDPKTNEIEESTWIRTKQKCNYTELRLDSEEECEVTEQTCGGDLMAKDCGDKPPYRVSCESNICKLHGS